MWRIQGEVITPARNNFERIYFEKANVSLVNYVTSEF